MHIFKISFNAKLRQLTKFLYACIFDNIFKFSLQFLTNFKKVISIDGNLNEFINFIIYKSYLVIIL